MYCRASCTVLGAVQVRLVLEYCDKGCLRDALDDGALLTPTVGHVKLM